MDPNKKKSEQIKASMPYSSIYLLEDPREIQEFYFSIDKDWNEWGKNKMTYTHLQELVIVEALVPRPLSSTSTMWRVRPAKLTEVSMETRSRWGPVVSLGSLKSALYVVLESLIFLDEMKGIQEVPDALALSKTSSLLRNHRKRERRSAR